MEKEYLLTYYLENISHFCWFETETQLKQYTESMDIIHKDDFEIIDAIHITEYQYLDGYGDR